MAHYLFQNETAGITITVSAPDFSTAVNCLSDTCKDFKHSYIEVVSFNYIKSSDSSKTDEYKPLGLRLNNPLNIRYNKRNNWVGLKGEKDGFCVFFSPVHGFRAGLRLLCNYVKSGFDTIEKIINRFAPSSENNTDDYIKFVCRQLFLSPDSLVNTLADVKSLCWAMSWYELGYKKLSNTQLEVLSSCLNIASTNYKYPLN